MKPFTLARVLQLAERRSETLARTVKLAHGVWLRARGRDGRRCQGARSFLEL